MAAGSQNRDTKKAINHLEISKNLKATCKCILHAKNLNEGTSIDRTKFNRQGLGIQSMCSKGKTLIDVIKHQFWRAIDIILLTAIKENNLYNKEYDNLLSIEFFKKNNIDIIIKNIFNSIEVKSFNDALIKNKIDIKIYFETSKYLENNLKLKNLKFYSIFYEQESLAIADYEKLENDFKEFTIIEKYKDLEPVFIELLANDFDYSFYIKETSQDNVFYELSMVSFNWSKKNNLYIKVNGNYIMTSYRGPFHNTRKKTSGATSRMVRFLIETGDVNGFKEVNSYIQSIRQPNHDADHIWPLALGGKHTIENIISLPKKENLLKKDHITFKAYSLLIDNWENTVEMISGDFLPIISKFYQKIKRNEQLFNENVKHFELELKNLMKKRQSNFEEMSKIDKIKFLGEMRKDLINSDKALKFIERFERNRG